MHRIPLVLGAITLSTLVLASACNRPSAANGRDEGLAGRPLLIMTGPQSEIDVPRYRLARSQEVFDSVWIEHMGDRVVRAAEGWPVTAQFDFDACDALCVFGGNGINADGYRVLDVIEDADAILVRYERISYQTMSLEGPDHGVPVRPWAVFVLPATDRTILLEENVQGIIGRPPNWKRRIEFPGRSGIERPVEGNPPHTSR